MPKDVPHAVYGMREPSKYETARADFYEIVKRRAELDCSTEVDYLINNAGFGGQGDFTGERTMEQDMSMIAVNIETPTHLCKLFLPDFVVRGKGKVLNVSSTAATMPGTGV